MCALYISKMEEKRTEARKSTKTREGGRKEKERKGNGEWSRVGREEEG
jgi:hypothetical protein